MAIDAVQLVKDQFAPVLSKSEGLEDAIPRQVEAQTVLQGLIPGTLTDQQKVYISVLAAYALIGPVLLEFAQKKAKAKGGPAEVEWQKAEDYLKLLQSQLANQVKLAAREAAPEDLKELVTKPFPFLGVESW
jgi:hypothetical protein